MLYNLDRLFAALADPTRRAILRRLAPGNRGGPAVVGEIAALFPKISLAAVSKHLHVLQRAGLVAAQRQGKFYRFYLLPDALRHTDQWLAHYRAGIAETAAKPAPAQNIALLGLSANPPHAGHLAISMALLELGYAEVWWSIAPEQEFKPAATLAPYAHRAALARLLIRDVPNLRLDDTEAAMAIKHEHDRTYEWLQHLAYVHPQHNFTFVMGADSWAHPAKGFHTWGGFEKCLQHAGLLVMPRPGQATGPTNAPAAKALNGLHYKKPGVVPRGRWAVYPAALMEISSTDIRQQLAAGQGPAGLTVEQLDYIRVHRLYGAHADH